MAELVAAAAPDVIFHLAAQIDVRRAVADPAFDAAVNVGGTINVLEAARRAGVPRVVFSSTGGAIYGDADTIPTAEDHAPAPMAPYGQSKHAAEGYCGLYGRLHGLSVVSLRYANVYGPRQDPHGEGGVVAIFCGKLVEGGTPVAFGDGLQTRDYVYVGDVVSANLAAAGSTWAGACNIGTGTETTRGRARSHPAGSRRRRTRSRSSTLPSAPGRSSAAPWTPPWPARRWAGSRAWGSARASSARWPRSAADPLQGQVRGRARRKADWFPCMPGRRAAGSSGLMHVATSDHHRLARAFLALADDLAPQPMRRSVRLGLAAVAACLVLAVTVPLAWMAPASRSLTSSKVGDQPAATLGSSKAVLADDEDDDGGE